MSGTTYLIYADRFSGTEVSKTNNANTKVVCNILRRYFMTFGVFEELSSDGGPPYNSYDFDTFLREWGIRHRSSSSYFSQSKVMKRMLLMTNISPSGSVKYILESFKQHLKNQRVQWFSDNINVTHKCIINSGSPKSDLQSLAIEIYNINIC